MVGNLDFVRSALLARLADTYEEAGWSDGLLEDALRQALGEFNRYSEVREITFVAPERGHEVDLAEIEPYTVLGIAWPWADGATFRRNLRSFRQVGATVYRFDQLDVPQHDKLRIAYQPFQHIAGLDGAEQTTLTPRELESFLTLASAYAFSLRARHNVMSSRYTLFMSLRERLREEFFEQIPPTANPFLEWGDLGL